MQSIRAMTENNASDLTVAEESRLAGELALAVPALSVRDTCGEVFSWFLNNPGVPAIAILDDDGSVAALVNRLIFLARYARQYSPELYSRKSILKLANTAPLLVDENVRIAELGPTLLDENPEALVECFVVTSKDRYRGIVTGEALLRCKVSLLQARETAMRRALEAAHDASRAKSNFLALMSHELRTPLNGIIGFSEILSHEMFGAIGNDRYRDYACDIHGAGRHLLALINDILDLSKAEAGKFDLDCQEIAPGDLVEECIRLMRDRAAASGLYIGRQVQADLPNLFVDRLRLKQMLLNLLSNAIKFTPRGGSVRLGAAVDRGGRLMLSVTDSGIGMAKESIPLALEPFCQIASPFSRNAEGTGLGLALVKSLMEMHGGKLEIESALQEGTVAQLVFPAARVIERKAALSA
jgi:two-component system cell cycle sensor histidine kinase PleC